MEMVRSTKEVMIMTCRYERSFVSAPAPASESPSNWSSFLERTRFWWYESSMMETATK